MTDIEIAKANLGAHSICLCKNGEYFTGDGRGISPMTRFIEQGRDLNGYSAADVVVGKAAAMLFVKAGIAEVYGKVMSTPACELLQSYKISFSYKALTEKIINREGTDICPMEKTVAGIESIDEGCAALQRKLREMRK